MNNPLAAALARVPENACNRETLARLLLVVEEVRESLEADAEASWRRRIEKIAALTLLAESPSTGQPEARKARAALFAAVDAARKHAERHGLVPNTRRTIRAEARTVLHRAR
jgi:hypothetical protein